MAAEGKNEVARSLLDLQPTAILELYKLYPDTVNSPSIYLSFHGGSVFGGNVTWQGIQYIPIPVEAEGFGMFGDGTLPRPKLRVSNNEKIVTYFLGKYKDFKNAKVYRKKVFVKHLDDSNFDGQNPFGLANSDSEISEEKYLIGQKVQENKSFVEFELNLPLDLDNFDVNHRTVNAKYCYWQYRGLGCRYEGKPIEKDDGSAFTNADDELVSLNNVNDEFAYENLFYQPDSGYSAGDVAYLENKSIILDRNEGEPVYLKTWYVCISGHSGQHPEDNPTYWQKDGCSKKIEACQKRFSSKSLQRTFVGEEDATSDYLNLTRDGAATFMTTAPAVTGVFDDDNWTLSLWVRGDRQHLTDAGTWLNPTIFATHELPRNVSTLEFEPNTDGTFTDTVKGNLHFSTRSADDEQKGLYLDFATVQQDGSGSKVYRVETKVASKEKFHCLVFRKIGTEANIEVLVDPRKDEYGRPTYSSKMTINSSNLGGADFFSLFGDKSSSINSATCFGGDIAQACLWSGKLTEEEITWIGSTNAISDSEYYLTDNGLQKTVDLYCDYTPLRYSEATGYLESLTGDDKLVFWYDMNTGLSATKLVIEDESPNGYDLTGFGATGEFEKRTIEYTKGNFESFTPNQNAQFVLPFGGFPGTDGFDFKALGSQNI